MMTFLGVLFVIFWAYRMRCLFGLILLVAGACLLAGCAGGPDLAGPQLNQVVIHQESFTQDQLTCADEPATPPQPRTPASVGRYIVDLRAAGADCRGALGAVRDRIKPPAGPPAPANAEPAS